MDKKKIIFYYSSDFCPFCIKFKKLLKFLECENMFQEINFEHLKFDKKIILKENTQLYTPIFFYYENNEKVLINNDMLLKKITENIDEKKHEEFKNFIEKNNIII